MSLSHIAASLAPAMRGPYLVSSGSPPQPVHEPPVPAGDSFARGLRLDGPRPLRATTASATPEQAVEALAATTVAPCGSFLGALAQAFTAPYLVRNLGSLAPTADAPSQGELDARPLRLYEAGPQGPSLVDFDARLAGSKPRAVTHRFHRVSLEKLDDGLARVAAERQQRLGDLEHAASNDRVVPKDDTLRPSAFYMSYSQSDAAALPFIRQMARIGRVEGFRVVAEVGQGQVGEVKQAVDPVERQNITAVPMASHGDVWVEDHGEMTLTGHVSVPAFVGDGDFIEDAILLARAGRFHPEADVAGLSGAELAALFPDIDFSKQGAVDDRRGQESMLALGLAAGVSLRQNLSYIEGGNMLPGTLPNGDGYALVGQDSIAISRALLSRDCGRAVSERETMAAIASDLGIRAGNVHPVEQPGEFHIDMRMALLGPGQVLLNDARSAAKIQAEWVREDNPPPPPAPPGASWLERSMAALRRGWWDRVSAPRIEEKIERLRKEGERRARFEDMAARDLSRAGLSVQRVAGVFVDSDNPDTDVANFLNGRPGTSPRGDRFLIALGGDPRAEACYARQLFEKVPTEVDRLYFLDRTLTPLTLDMFGGIKCRSKTEGSI